MKILICGMPRSMTTWTFNIVRELLAGQPLKTLWIDPNDTAAEAEFVTFAGNVVGKCHHFSEELRANAELIIYSYRDIRTAAVSYRRKFNVDPTFGHLYAWTLAGDAWAQSTGLVLRYEAVEQQPKAGVRQLREALVAQFGDECVSAADDEIVLDSVADEFSKRQIVKTIYYDGLTMILPEHRTFQPPPDQLSAAERALYDRVEHHFSRWLTINGYITPDSYGQDTEYHLVSAILNGMVDPIVVDVGAERGSFTALALNQGALKVICFEALPRHIDALNQRFASDSRVDVRAVAVSRRSGRVRFYIALDREGRELVYHHTLGDLGSSASVARDAKAIDVEAISLGELAAQGKLSPAIDFLKIDTAGHDLEVLHGLGELRPRIILAEYWDNLSQPSGQAPYSVRELAQWATERRYQRIVVIRRNGLVESIEWDAAWSNSGDWGKVIFVRDNADLTFIAALVTSYASKVKVSSYRHVNALIKECEQKEAEIRRLQNELNKSVNLTENLEKEVPSEVVVLPDGATSGALDWREVALEKETVIQDLVRALRVYRVALFFLWPVITLLGFFMRHIRAALRPRLGTLNQYPARPLPQCILFPKSKTLDAYPTISIVTPSYQQGQFIGRTIQSVLDQGYSNLEYYIQDGGSLDDTLQVLKRYEDKISGWASERDSGQSQAINRAFTRTHGEIMAWLNSDDLLLPGALPVVADYFNRHPDVDVVYGNRLLIDENGMEIGRWILPGHDSAVLSWADFIPQETLFWRRRIWDAVGGQIDESFRFAMDWDLLVRFRDAGAKFGHVPKFLGAFRVHKNQKTSTKIQEIGALEMDRIRYRIFGRVPDKKSIRRAVSLYLATHVAIDMLDRVRGRLGLNT